MEIITESIKYTFTPDELVSIAKNQARLMNDKSALDEQFDNLRADHKSKITRVDADISDHNRRITAGYEMRSVDCLVLKFRPDQKSVLVVRTDSGRVVRQRKLTEDEKQLKLTDKEPETWAFEADFYRDAEGDVSELMAEDVPLTEKEAEKLRDVIELRPIRKMLGDGQ